MIELARPIIETEEIEAVIRVLESGILTQGPEVSNFEKEFSSAIGCSFGVAVNSGTSALHLSLLSLGIGPGDEVIVPSFTFAATANAVALTGATPIFADIDLNTFNIDPLDIESKITSRTKAIQVVHLFGQPAQMEKITSIAKKHGLLLLEDAAQAHFAKFRNQNVGTFGSANSFSFYPTKNMMSGEGGMILTSDPMIDRTCRILRNQGMETKYQNELIGFNYRMTDISAAIGRVQLKKVLRWTKKRQEIAKFYDQNLEGVKIPPVIEDAEHVYHQYTIRVIDHNRDQFIQQLEKLGVRCGVYYPTPVHRLPAYHQQLDLPNSERASKEVISIPIHPKLNNSELDQVVSAINKISLAGK